jgi:hypothetical protein
MLVSNDSIVVVDVNAPAARVALHHWQPNTPDGQGTPFLFHHGRNAANSTGGALMRIFKVSAGSAEDYEFPRAIAFAASAIRSSAVVAVTCDKEIITGDYFILLLNIIFIYSFSVNNWYHTTCDDLIRSCFSYLILSCDNPTLAITNGLSALLYFWN